MEFGESEDYVLSFDEKTVNSRGFDPLGVFAGDMSKILGRNPRYKKNEIPLSGLVKLLEKEKFINKNHQTTFYLKICRTTGNEERNDNDEIPQDGFDEFREYYDAQGDDYGMQEDDHGIDEFREFSEYYGIQEDDFGDDILSGGKYHKKIQKYKAKNNKLIKLIKSTKQRQP